MKVNIAILVSGEGTNTENIINYFYDYVDAEISCIISNDDSSILKKIRRYKIDKYITPLYKDIDKILTEYNIDYIVLDNWYEQIPPNFCIKYKYKIINIDKSLTKTTETFSNTDLEIDHNESGINIHFVDIDKKIMIFEKKVKIFDTDTQDTITSKTNELEGKYYPIIIENLIRNIHQ